jgi:hypothetical protein
MIHDASIPLFTVLVVLGASQEEVRVVGRVEGVKHGATFTLRTDWADAREQDRVLLTGTNDPL